MVKKNYDYTYKSDIEKSSVFELQKECLWEYEFTEPKRFAPLYDEKQREALANLYAEYAGGIAFDGTTVCLEGVSEKKDGKRLISLSTGSFYDFVCCNLLAREVASQDPRILRYLSTTGASPEIVTLAKTLGKKYSQEKEFVGDFFDCVYSSFLPNTIAVSILVRDPKGQYLLSRRTSNVLLGKHLFGVTATGSVDVQDMLMLGKDGKGINPFCACAMREIKEETSLDIAPDDFKLRALVIGKAKLQPIALVDATTRHSLPHQYKEYNPSGDTFDAEIEKLVAIGPEQIKFMIGKYDMTEAAEHHIKMHCS